ncbi:hypothetical protein M758_7G056300 [Ceratodon purpureus]|uniref:Uncharacterized protein n=1 Tax=Ceratodon purpureus TaxID=3225 RepID=A0A8T0H2Q3_CERPU|nr:hypothetical protein KC19_7G058800 [Ceratodon purpureus]KAG0610319.1 hypothetical protein M758_7G056300 [Ceratodon purpureus]
MYNNLASELCCILMRLVESITMYMFTGYKSEVLLWWRWFSACGSSSNLRSSVIMSLLTRWLPDHPWVNHERMSFTDLGVNVICFMEDLTCSDKCVGVATQFSAWKL